MASRDIISFAMKTAIHTAGKSFEYSPRLNDIFMHIADSIPVGGWGWGVESQLEAEEIPPDSGIGYSWIFNQDYGSSFGKTFVEVKRFSRPSSLLSVLGNTGVGEIILIGCCPPCFRTLLKRSNNSNFFRARYDLLV